MNSSTDACVAEPHDTCANEAVVVDDARVVVDPKALDPEGPDPFGVIGTTLLGRYRVQRVAGRGGQGVVYEAEHERLKRPVAIKFLLVDATEGPTALKRFEREAEILARLSHPSIVHIYDIATHSDGETPIMVMEFVRGESLSVRLQDRKRTPWREAFALVAQAASALGASHAQDIIHRDIKPDNLIVCDDGTVKVLDFGIAQLITELSNTESGRGPRRRLTAMNMVPGTTGYMSPEQFVAGTHLDGRSDVYSLGVVLYRLISLKRLWPTVERHEIAQLVQTQDPIDVRVHVPDLPHATALVVQRAIARDRAQRFQSMEEMRDALLQCLGEGATATAARALDEASQSTTLLDGPTTSSPGVTETHRSARYSFTQPRRVVAMIAAACGVAAAAIFFLRNPQSEHATPRAPSSVVETTAAIPTSSLAKTTPLELVNTAGGIDTQPPSGVAPDTPPHGNTAKQSTKEHRRKKDRAKGVDPMHPPAFDE